MENILKKTRIILQSYAHLHSKYKNIVMENETLRKVNQAQQLKIQELENKNKTLKTAKAKHLSPNDRANMKETINELIQDIDQCIALLNK